MVRSVTGKELGCGGSGSRGSRPRGMTRGWPLVEHRHPGSQRSEVRRRWLADVSGGSRAVARESYQSKRRPPDQDDVAQVEPVFQEHIPADRLLQVYIAEAWSSTSVRVAADIVSGQLAASFTPIVAIDLPVEVRLADQRFSSYMSTRCRRGSPPPDSPRTGSRLPSEPRLYKAIGVVPVLVDRRVLATFSRSHRRPAGCPGRRSGSC